LSSPSGHHETRRVLAGGFLFVGVHTDGGLLARQTEALVKLYMPS
jgi:hypothetical protein